jgi:hypothetical protein
MPYTESDVTAAIARANGQKLANIRTNIPAGQSQEALGKSRTIVPQGGMPYAKSTGHVFAHVATFTEGSISPHKSAIFAAQAGKSLWADRRTAIAAATELINSPQAKPGIQEFLTGPARTSPVWLKHIPLDDNYYGIDRPHGETFVRKAETGSINFWITAGTLYIYSCYPDGFVAGVKGLRVDTDVDLSSTFG